MSQIGEFFITSWGKCYYKIGVAPFYYKLGQVLLQIWAAFLLQIPASFITNQSSYYKLGQPLLEIGAAITNWGNYYKLGHNSTSLLIGFA